MEFQVVKSWQKMKWSRADAMYSAPVDADIMNRLSKLTTLPEAFEAVRQRLNAVIEAVDKERFNENPKEMYPYPVKLPLFKHQIRGANMAMLTFGLIAPKKDGEKND